MYIIATSILKRKNSVIVEIGKYPFKFNTYAQKLPPRIGYNVKRMIDDLL